jgi:hypothetical protein
MLVGVVLILLASLGVPGSWQTELYRSLGLTLFATFFVSSVYSFFLRSYLSDHIQGLLFKMLQPAVQSLARVREEAGEAMQLMASEADSSLRSIKADLDSFTGRLRSDVERMVIQVQAGVELFRAAQAGGIRNIYTDRGKGMQALREAIAQAKGEVRIIGISLGDFFLDRGLLCSAVREILDDADSEVRLRCLLADPQGTELRERARWEAGEEFCYDPVFYNSTTFIETDGCARMAQYLCEKHHERLDARLYAQAPVSFVVLTPTRLFVEQYHYAGRGSNAPLLEADANSAIHKAYERHFEGLWRRARPISGFDPLHPHRAD